MNEVGRTGWVTLCHADEFFYHDPRKVAALAESQGADGIMWFALHFLPHPNDLRDGRAVANGSALDRIRHYHWGFENTGLPWKEFRSFRNHGQIGWDASKHGDPQPFGCQCIASFHPAYRHYKVFSLDPTFYASGDGWTEFSRHWQGVVAGRTGLNWEARSVQDLFVERYEPYEHCDLFEGAFHQAWNIGEQYR